jgi:hypothetical protein
VIVAPPEAPEESGELLPDAATPSASAGDTTLPSESAKTAEIETPTRPRSKRLSSGRLIKDESNNQPLLDPAKVELVLKSTREVEELLASAPGEAKSEMSLQYEPNVLDDRSRDELLRALNNEGQSPPGFERPLHVGRSEEIREILMDIDRISNGSSAFRCLTGPNGVGKTFIVRQTSGLALSRGLAVVNFDLEGSLHFAGQKGESRKLIGKILRELRTPAGNGVEAIPMALVDKLGIGTKKGAAELPARIRKLFKPLEGRRLADPLRRVLVVALRGLIEGDADAVDNATRWLTAAYDSIKDAKQQLGVSTILKDDDLFDYLALLAEVMVLCGWRGLMVVLDEVSLISIHLPTPARKSNWNWVLNVVNSMNRGDAPHLGLILSGSEDLIDQKRGLFSNRSLASRLGSVRNGDAGVLGPVIYLNRFTPEELFVMVSRFRDLILPLDERTRFPDEAIVYLLGQDFSVLGADQSVTPRDVLKEFATRMKRLLANPGIAWPTLFSPHATTST